MNDNDKKNYIGIDYENDYSKQFNKNKNKYRMISVLSIVITIVIFILSVTASIWITIYEKEWASVYIFSVVVTTSSAAYSLITAIKKFISTLKLYSGINQSYSTMCESLKDIDILLNDGAYDDAYVCINMLEKTHSTALSLTPYAQLRLRYLAADCVHLQSKYGESITVIDSELSKIPISKNKHRDAGVDPYLYEYYELRMLKAHCKKHMGEFDEAYEIYNTIMKELKGFDKIPTELSSLENKIQDKIISLLILRLYTKILFGFENKDNVIYKPDEEELKDSFSKCSDEYKTRYKYVVNKLIDYINKKPNTRYESELDDLQVEIKNSLDFLDGKKNGITEKKARLVYNSIFISAEAKRLNGIEENSFKDAIKEYLLCYDAALLKHDYNMFSQVCVILKYLEVFYDSPCGHDINITEIKGKCAEKNMHFNMKLCSILLQLMNFKKSKHLDEIITKKTDIEIYNESVKELINRVPMIIL